MSINIAIVGATGKVGIEIFKVLDELNIPINNIYPIASESSVGKKIIFRKREVTICSLKDFDFSKVDVAFFSAGSAVSKEFVPIAAKDCYVIDNTPCFRRDQTVPLVVPEINSEQIKNTPKNIIANPNCAAIQIAVAANVIHQISNIKKMVISTYQSVSGAGNSAYDELEGQILSYAQKKELSSKVFPRRILGNVIPQIDKILENKSTGEEDKVAFEIKKIINSDISVDVTCVRVPVFVGHAASVYLEFSDRIDFSLLEKRFESSTGIVYSRNDYFTPQEIEGDNEVYVSRVRKSNDTKNALNMWVVADNLRKGAAYNAAQICKHLYKY